MPTKRSAGRSPRRSPKKGLDRGKYNGGPAANTKWTFRCPLCGAANADVTPKPPGSQPPHWIGCWKCEAEGLRNGDYLRALAEAVGAPGGAVVLENPHAYLATRASLARQGEPPPRKPQIEGWHERLFTPDGLPGLNYLT